MGRRKAEAKDEDQLELIETEPENKKEILRVARKYRRTQQERISALAVEIREKAKLLAVVRAAEIVPETDGSYRFNVDGLTITVTPRDELVKVKFPDEEED